MDLVGYLVARDGLPSRHGLAYDYVLAGDGLYLTTENNWLEVCIPVAHCLVRGLPVLYPNCVLKYGRLPYAIWQEFVQIASDWARGGYEILLTVTHDESNGYRLNVPQQVIGPERVFYRPSSDAVLEIHSHHRFSAQFSMTDDRDEQRLCLYSIVGRLNGNCPKVAIRVGAYGYFMPIPWESVFEGNKSSFRDMHFDIDPATEVNHVLS